MQFKTGNDFYGICTCLILSFPVFSQSGHPVLDKLAAGQLHTLSQNSPAEIVYIQTSKGIYE